MAPSSAKALTHQPLIAMQLSVMAGHQPQSTERPMQTFQGIAGIEHFKGVLQWIAPPAVHRGVNLNISPREDKQQHKKWAAFGDQLLVLV